VLHNVLKPFDFIREDADVFPGNYLIKKLNSDFIFAHFRDKFNDNFFIFAVVQKVNEITDVKIIFNANLQGRLPAESLLEK
jgi:hypothetical protein